MTTTIHSNGSKWAGQAPDPIEALFERLAEHPLDRSFEAFGNFVTVGPVNLRGEPMTAPGGASFFGNFLTYSHVFRIETDDPELIATLTAAIRVNQQRADYIAQPPPFVLEKLEIVRHRFSVTQGEVELRYDGERLEQFGDKIELRADAFWADVSRKWLADRHRALIAKAWANLA